MNNNESFEEKNSIENQFMYKGKCVNKFREPLLTLMVTSYNQEKIISKTINSLIKQKTKYKYEILISDDCSTDNTLSILREYERKYDFVKVIEVVDKKKVGKNRNNLLENLETLYGCFIDGDDPQDENYVDSIIKKISGKELYKISAMIQVWDKKKEKINIQELYGPCIYIFSKEIARKIKFDEDLAIGEDLMLAIKYYDLLSNQNIEIIDVIYKANRKNENISLTINTNIEERYKLELDLYEKIKKYKEKGFKTDKLIYMKAIDVIIYQFILKYKLNEEKIKIADQKLMYKITYIMIYITSKIHFELPLRVVLKKYVESRI